MLPGFSKDELFMAIEGFTSGSHNRSDEAFTVADLEEFKMDNFIDAREKAKVNAKSTPKTVVAEEDMDESAAETTKPEMVDDEEYADNAVTTTTTTTRAMPTKKTTTTKRAIPTKKTTNNRENSGNMQRTTKYAKSGKKGDMVDKTNSESPFKNLEPYEDEMDANEEDPENPEDDRGMETELVDGELEAEDAPVEPEDLAAEETAEEASIEGFTGSATANEYYLKTFLKALLITFICFVLCHTYTGKVLTKFIHGIHKDVLVFILLFALIYVVLVAF